MPLQRATHPGLLREESQSKIYPRTPGFSPFHFPKRRKSHGDPALANEVFLESSSTLIISARGVNNWASWVTDQESRPNTLTLGRDRGKHQGRPG